MKYSTEIIIDLPRAEVIKKMDNTDNMKHWQRGLISAEHLSGTPGEVGAKMKLNYKFGKREMALTETIVKNDFPREFNASYETKGMYNMQENLFEETANGQTKWTSTSTFTSTSFALKLMMFLMPGSFKKQTLKYMTDFKNFAENGTSVAAS